jgi:hypothetical protein
MDREFGKLVNAALSNPEDGKVHEELSARLESNPAERAQYLEYCRLHGDLYFLIASENAEKVALDDLGALALQPTSTTPSRMKSGQLPKGRVAYGLVALAASLLAVMVWYREAKPVVYQEGLRQPTIVASIVFADDVVWKKNEYSPGESLRLGTRLQIESGVVKVNMPPGAELVLQGPCDVVLESPDRVVLHEGKVSAHVAEWASGFAVETSSLKVVDLGTQFAVEADANGNTEAHVLKGNVRIKPVDVIDRSRTSFLLGEGEAVRVNALQRTSMRLDAEQDRFAADHGDFRPYRPIEIHNTGKHLSIGDEDPHWRLVAGTVGEGYQGPQYAVVCNPDERYLPNNPDVSQWMSVAKDLRPGCLPNATYTYQTEFDLSEYELSTVIILADILADNGVAAVRINGKPVDLVPWKDNKYLQEFHAYRRAEIIDGFLVGKNTIEIDVWNGIYHFNPDTKASVPSPNPMSIRVEWQAFGIPKSTEATTAKSTI